MNKIIKIVLGICVVIIINIVSYFVFINNEPSTSVLHISGLPIELINNKVFLDSLGVYEGRVFSFSKYSEEDLKDSSFGYRGEVSFTEVKAEEYSYKPTIISFSPNGKRALFIPGCDYCDPDSDVWLYNRKLEGFTERVASCGTPCSFSAVFWLNDSIGVYISSGEASPFGDDPEIRKLILSILDLEKNRETVYVSEPVVRAEP